MWPWLQKLLMHQNGRLDAEHGIEALDDQLKRYLGEKPVFSPAAHESHAQLTADMAKAGELDETRRDIADTEEQLRHLPSPQLLSVGILILLLSEFFAASLLLAGLGMSGIERLVLAMALTAGIVFLTGRVIEAAPSIRQTDSPPGPHFRLLVGVYVILLAALAITRGASVEADVEGGGIVRAGYVLLLLAIAAGPSWLVERWMRERKLPAALLDKLAMLKRREKELARVVHRAERFAARLSEKAVAWEQSLGQLAAEYRLAHRRERATAPEALPAARRRKP